MGVDVSQQYGATPATADNSTKYATTAWVRNVLATFAAAASDVWAGTSTALLVTPKSLFDASAFVALTDAATIAVDMSTLLNATVTLGGNRALANPTNMKVGQSGVIRVVQDATGSRTLSYGTAYDFGAAGAPTLQTGANKEDLIFYVVMPGATRLRCTFSKGA